MIAPARLREITRALRKSFPAPDESKVRVRQTDLTDHGLTERSESGTFYITLRKQDRRSIVIDTLLHEWAHVLTWKGDGFRQHVHHSEAWGREYARLTRWANGEGEHAPSRLVRAWLEEELDS